MLHHSATSVIIFYNFIATDLIAANTVTSGRSQSELNNDYRVVVFGAAGVGKSLLVLRFVISTLKETCFIPRTSN